MIAHFDEFKPMWIEEIEDGTSVRGLMCGESVWDWLEKCRGELAAKSFVFFIDEHGPYYCNCGATS